MPRSFRSLHRSSVLIAALALVSIASVFGAGVVVRATMGGDALRRSTRRLMAGRSGGVPAIGRLIDTGNSSTSSSGGGYAGPYPGVPGMRPRLWRMRRPDCGRHLNGDDRPSKLNFTPNMLGSGFTLTGVSFASQGRAPRTAQPRTRI